MLEGAEPGDISKSIFLNLNLSITMDGPKLHRDRDAPEGIPIYRIKVLHYDTAAGTTEFIPGIT